MESYHRQVAILVPDDKLDCYVLSDFFCFWQKQSSFLSGTSVATYTPHCYIVVMVMVSYSRTSH